MCGRMRKDKAIKEIDKWRDNPQNVRFERLCIVAEAFGFRFARSSGSHRIYVLDGVKEILDFQVRDGKAKPYQAKQLIDLVDKYKLERGEVDAGI